MKFQDRVYVRRLEKLCDTVVHLDSFVGSDKEKNPAYKEYHGRTVLFGIYGPRNEKTCLLEFGNNTGADQPAYPRSLISAFVIRILERIISKLATS